MQTRDHRPTLLLISALVILLDRLSKNWITANILPGRARTLVPGVFRLTHVLNTGAAFSLGDSLSPTLMRNGLIAFSRHRVLIVAVMLWRVAAHSASPPSRSPSSSAARSATSTTASPSATSSTSSKSPSSTTTGPTFNVADSCIVIGACLLMLEIFLPQPAG